MFARSRAVSRLSPLLTVSMPFANKLGRRAAALCMPPVPTKKQQARLLPCACRLSPCAGEARTGLVSRRCGVRCPPNSQY